jgi:hypothetical protein
MKISKFLLVVLLNIIIASVIPVGNINNVAGAPLEQTGKIGK